jgi:hypothetical protein
MSKSEAWHRLRYVTYRNKGQDRANAGEEASVDAEQNQFADHGIGPPEASARLLEECAEEDGDKDVPSSCKGVHRH